MKMYKKGIALLLEAIIIFTLAGCSGESDKETTAATTKTETETVETEGAESEEEETKAAEVSGDALKINTTDGITITFGWWGGDSRHQATLAAIEAFEAKYPNITIEPTYGAWGNGDWETKMSAQYAAGTASDVSQINWNWIEAYSNEGQTFVDLNDYAGIIDLSQFPEAALTDSTFAGELQGIPISLTGRIFYWDKTTFDEAGIHTPTSLEELRAAGATFKEVLGEEYYPLAMNEYDRMVFMVFYLESVYGKAWVEDGELQYSEEEIFKGLEFIQSLEDDHVIPGIRKLAGDGADSIDKNSKWTDGTYAGIFEWDSSAFDNKKYYDDIISQYKNVREFLYCEDARLYYHGYDEAKIQMWADKETGQSGNFWLRAMGWFLMSLTDNMYIMDKNNREDFKVLEDIFIEALTGILNYQDKETNLFYQIIDKKEVEGNYLETSGSAMIAYVILEGCRLGILQKEQYEEIGVGIIRSLMDLKIIEENGVLKLSDMCSVAGLGSDNMRDGTATYYLSEPVVCDNQKGTGAFMMAYAQMLLLRKEGKTVQCEHS